MKRGFLLVTLAALTIGTAMIVGGILQVCKTPTPQNTTSTVESNQDSIVGVYSSKDWVFYTVDSVATGIYEGDRSWVLDTVPHVDTVYIIVPCPCDTLNTSL